MKTANVRTKIGTRLFRGLALGAVLVVAASLYFSFNLGEAGSPLVSEQTEVYPGFLQAEVWLPGDTYPASALSSPLSNREIERMDYEIDSALFDAARNPAAGSSLASEQGACYPLYPELGPCATGFSAVAPTTVDRYDRGLFDEVLPDDLKQGEAGSPVSGVQFEEWPEVGFDSYTYHRFMMEQGKAVSRLSSEQLQLIDDLEIMGMPWRIDDEGKVVVVEASLNQGKVGSRPSINGITCYPEDDC